MVWPSIAHSMDDEKLKAKSTSVYIESDARSKSGYIIQPTMLFTTFV